MAYPHKLQLKPLSMALAMVFTVSPISLRAADSVRVNTGLTQLVADNKSMQKKVEIDAITLDTVNVNSSRQDDAEDGYQATKTRVGKMLQDPHNIPQAITTVTHSLMHDQQIGSLREALSNVAGLTFNAAEGGRSGDNMNLRGFYTFGDIYLDGIRDSAQYNRETFNLEQIDVLRGSAAMLFGRGQAGGVINQVSKIPKLKDESHIAGSIGNNHYQQFTGDFNQQLSDTMAVRVNVMDRSEQTYRKNPANGDSPELNRHGIALSVAAGLGTDDELVLSHIYTQTRDMTDYGVSFGANKKPSTTFSDATYWGAKKTFDDSDTNISSATYTHKFSADTQWRTQLRNASYERAYWAKKPSATLAPTANAGATGDVTRTLNYETVTVQSDFNTKLNLLGMQHQLLTGVEYLKENAYRQGLRNIGTTANPLYDSTQVSGVASTFNADNYALYVQDTIEFIPKWDLLLGVRRDQMQANYMAARPTALNYAENSYRSGLSWRQTPEKHYYLSWSDSFSPTADLYQLTVAPLPAERSETLELGAKWLLLDGDLALRAAVYRANKAWERSTDLESTASVLTKKRRTDGVEFELAGRISSKWEVFSGLALMDATILEVAENINAQTGAVTAGDSRFVGQRARNTPVATFNLWTSYKLAENWKLGAGVEAKASRYGYDPAQTAAQTSGAGGTFSNGEFNPNTLPGYARIDAMLSYEQKQWALRLNVKNLLDKTYYDALYERGGFTLPGNRRAAILTTEYKF